MTVGYMHKVHSSKYWSFFRLLIRWKGSVYKLVWFEIFVFCAVYALLSLIYRSVMSPEQKKVFESVCLYCEKFSNFIPLAFVLGFFVSLIVTRWWEQFMSLPWPESLAVFVTCYIRGTTDHLLMIRRTILRYVNLAFILCLRSISSPVRKRFPTEDHLVEAGMITRAELGIYRSIDVPYNKFYVPVVWALNLACQCRREGITPTDPQINMIMAEFMNYRDRLNMLFWYDWINPPLVYVQVATISVHTYFIAALFGRQFLDPDAQYPNHKVDYYIPIFALLQFIFYMGWMKVAESLINPFGEDDDDFDVNYIIDRNIQLSYLIVDKLHQTHPELVRDAFWDTKTPDLPSYTASPSTQQVFLTGSVSNLQVSRRKSVYTSPSVLHLHDATDGKPPH